MFCIDPKNILSELRDRLKMEMPEYVRRLSGGMFNDPFGGMPYISDLFDEPDSKYFILVSRAEFEPPFGSEKPTIDLMFHAHNLLVSSWKRIQKRDRLPYLKIVEYFDPNNDSIKNRQRFDDVPLPHFIDPKGKRKLNKDYE